ncbi:MAG: family 10 glycosylhydrolase [Phycisphaerae bacterium]|nr:family 10 glycosylhydrolase [Phycisphaerae bacterium]
MHITTRARTVLLSTLGVILGMTLSPALGQVLIVDNTDPGFTVLTENWYTTSATGQYGSDYRYRSTTLATGQVEWRPTIADSGEYAVDVWYRSSVDRPSDAVYSVHHAGGQTDITIDQRLNGSEWVPLGVFNLSAGTSDRVVLSSDADPGNTIVADAVRFRRLDVGETVPEVRACWLSHYTYVGKSELALRQMAQNMLAGNMNTVYFAVYSGQTVWWPSQAYKAAGGSWGSSTIDYCERLTRIFREEGLSVGAWFEYGLALGYATHPIATAHPEWLARDRYGDEVTGENGGFVFISPGHPDGTQLIVDMVRELANNYGFDDIQIDRIRWGRKDTGREYGYEQVTSDLYQQQYGSAPPTNVNNAVWVGFRESLVNDVAERCYGAIKAANSEIVVSSAPTGYYGIVQHMQRWSDWVSGGYMDLVMPQMYKTSLSTFQTEFDLQIAEIPGHEDKLGVGYVAQGDDDWSMVASQLEYARSSGVPHGCLWVYHQYTSQIAIQDEIDNLPSTGEPWEQPAHNPFTSPLMVQLFADDDDGAPKYDETGIWQDSAQTDYFRFGSRIAAGGNGAEATFRVDIPKGGRYDAFVWYTSGANRNDQTLYEFSHYNGTDTVAIDQRAGGGQWVVTGRWVYDAGDSASVTVSTAGSTGVEYTAADGFKLRWSGYALGDANGDDAVDDLDFVELANCGLSGPGVVGGTTCEAFDIDDDLDFDMSDLPEFQVRFGK